MPTITIPTPLRPQTGGLDKVEASGATVGDTLKALGDQYPEFLNRIFEEDGELRGFVNVYLNNEDIRFLDDLDTPVKDGDEINIIPAVAGG